MLSRFERFAHEFIMGVVGRRDIDDVDLFVFEDIIDPVIDHFHLILFRERDGFLMGSVGDGVETPAHLLEGGGHFVGDDAGAEDGPV